MFALHLHQKGKVSYVGVAGGSKSLYGFGLQVNRKWRIAYVGFAGESKREISVRV